MLMLGKALRTVWCRFGSWSLVTWWCRVCLFICFCSTFSCCNIDWSYEQHELTGVTSVYKAEIESVKWNFHFFLYKTNYHGRALKEFSKGDFSGVPASCKLFTIGPLLLPPPGLLLAGQCLTTWTWWNWHFNGDSHQSPNPLVSGWTPKGGTTERQVHQEMSNPEGQTGRGTSNLVTNGTRRATPVSLLLVM